MGPYTNETMSKRPTHCPYCETRVAQIRLYMRLPTPDENPPEWPMVDDATRTPDTPGHDTRECRLMIPCGHLFDWDKYEAWEAGDLPAARLGDAVVNPQSPVDTDAI